MPVVDRVEIFLVCVSHSVASDSLQPHGLESPWNSLGQNTGVNGLSLLQGISPTQGWNLGRFNCRQILYHLSHKWKCQLLEVFLRRRKWKLRDRLGPAQAHRSCTPSSPRPVARPTAPTPLPFPQGNQRLWGLRGRSGDSREMSP